MHMADPPRYLVRQEMGTTVPNLLRDIANKAMELVSHPATIRGHAILGDLNQNDPGLSVRRQDADEAYHTITAIRAALSPTRRGPLVPPTGVMSGSGRTTCRSS